MGSVLIWNSSPKAGGWHGNSFYQPGRLVSLLEMTLATMFDLNLVPIHTSGMRMALNIQKKIPDRIIVAEFLERLKAIDEICEKFELANARNRYGEFARYFKSGGYPTIEAIEAQLNHALDAFISDLDSRKFVYVPADNGQFFEQGNLLGQLVYDVFEDARIDAKAAGNCLALDFNTAAVFHMMRAVELALYAIAKRLKVKKVGKTPISESDWGKIIEEIQSKVDYNFRKQWPPNKKKPKPTAAKKKRTENFKFLLIECAAIKDLWRNTVSHSLRNFTATEARGILDHVKKFMERAAIEVSS